MKVKLSCEVAAHSKKSDLPHTFVEIAVAILTVRAVVSLAKVCALILVNCLDGLACSGIAWLG